jgi:predicted RNA methylase
LLKGLGLPRESGFLDLGSGKGRALLLAAQHGFRRVVGVEFSPQLCRLARANIATFEKSTPLPSPIEIVEADAARYEIGSDLNVFYLYNPFEPPVLSKVLENLRRSVASAPRRIWLIYNNPRHHELIRQSGLFGGHSCHDIGGTDFNVYTG